MMERIAILHRLAANFNLACERPETRNLEADLRHARMMGPTEIIFTPQERQLCNEMKERAGFLLTPREKHLLLEWP